MKNGVYPLNRPIRRREDIHFEGPMVQFTGARRSSLPDGVEQKARASRRFSAAHLHIALSAQARVLEPARLRRRAVLPDGASLPQMFSCSREVADGRHRFSGTNVPRDGGFALGTGRTSPMGASPRILRVRWELPPTTPHIGNAPVGAGCPTADARCRWTRNNCYRPPCAPAVQDRSLSVKIYRSTPCDLPSNAGVRCRRPWMAPSSGREATTRSGTKP